MPLSFHLSVVSVEGEQYSGLVNRVSVTTANGPVGIYYGHAPLLCRLKAGGLEICPTKGECEFMFVAGGFMEVQRSGTTILVDTCERVADLDQQKAVEAKENAYRCLQDCSDTDDLRQAYAALEASLARLRIIERSQRIRHDSRGSRS